MVGDGDVDLDEDGDVSLDEEDDVGLDEDGDYGNFVFDLGRENWWRAGLQSWGHISSGFLYRSSAHGETCQDTIIFVDKNVKDTCGQGSEEYLFVAED